MGILVSNPRDSSERFFLIPKNFINLPSSSPVSDASDPAVEDGCLAEDGRHVARVSGDVARLQPRLGLRGHGGPEVVYSVLQLLSSRVINLIQLETSAAVQLGRKS